jgi:hypothetical protein
LRRSITHTYAVWQSTLQRIRKSEEVQGIEKGACVLFQGLRIISISHWFIHTWKGIERYVFGRLVVLVLLLVIVPQDHLWGNWVVFFFTIYILFELYTVHFQIMFLSKFVAAPPKSAERSLLLFILNVAELLIAFAIFYRGRFGLRVGEAITNATLVFGTIGYRNDIVDIPPIVAVQILLDFLLLAIFLATLIGRVGPFEKRTSAGN